MVKRLRDSDSDSDQEHENGKEQQKKHTAENPTDILTAYNETYIKVQRPG